MQVWFYYEINTFTNAVNYKINYETRSEHDQTIKINKIFLDEKLILELLFGKGILNTTD